MNGKDDRSADFHKGLENIGQVFRVIDIVGPMQRRETVAALFQVHLVHDRRALPGKGGKFQDGVVHGIADIDDERRCPC